MSVIQEQQHCSQWVYKLRLMSFICICVFITDLILAGDGSLTSLGSLKLRYAAFLLGLVFAIPVMWHECRSLLRNPYIWATLLLVAYLAICGLRGYLAGNRQDVIFKDITGFLNFLLLPAALSVFHQPKRFRTLLCIYIGASSLLAMTGLATTYIMNGAAAGEWSLFINRYTLGSAIEVRPRTFEVFFHSYRLLLPGLVGYLFFLRDGHIGCWKISLCIVGMVIQCAAVFRSCSRSLYLGAFITIVVGFCLLCLFSSKSQIKRLVLSVCAVALGTLVLLGLMAITQRSEPFHAALQKLSIDTSAVEIAEALIVEKKKEAPDRLLEDMRSDAFQTGDISINYAVSDMLREETLWDLEAMISENPVLGNGLGASIASRKSGLVEYNYHDFLNKMGVVGLLIYMGPLLIMIWVLVCLLLRRHQWVASVPATLFLAMFPAWVGLLAMAYFNPAINSSDGISTYCLAASASSFMFTKGDLCFS